MQDQRGEGAALGSHSLTFIDSLIDSLFTACAPCQLQKLGLGEPIDAARKLAIQMPHIKIKERLELTRGDNAGSSLSLNFLVWKVGVILPRPLRADGGVLPDDSSFTRFYFMFSDLVWSASLPFADEGGMCQSYLPACSRQAQTWTRSPGSPAAPLSGPPRPPLPPHCICLRPGRERAGTCPQGGAQLSPSQLLRPWCAVSGARLQAEARGTDTASDPRGQGGGGRGPDSSHPPLHYPLLPNRPPPPGSQPCLPAFLPPGQVPPHSGPMTMTQAESSGSGMGTSCC